MTPSRELPTLRASGFPSDGNPAKSNRGALQPGGISCTCVQEIPPGWRGESGVVAKRIRCRLEAYPATWKPPTTGTAGRRRTCDAARLVQHRPRVVAQPHPSLTDRAAMLVAQPVEDRRRRRRARDSFCLLLVPYPVIQACRIALPCRKHQERIGRPTGQRPTGQSACGLQPIRQGRVAGSAHHSTPAGQGRRRLARRPVGRPPEEIRHRTSPDARRIGAAPWQPAPDTVF